MVIGGSTLLPEDAAVAHPGTDNTAANPRAATAALRDFLVPFAFMIVPFV
ncbi:hypothetical protein I550_4096 [Mycobacterium intracellulare 1956]|uniref:Uncharacterized protein n=1 Tax=Mycobacterium intracellulare 1956 TaxID=1299331 RepID=X8CIM1_MYCIT|nr:hypothetical protein I550_4096 [Mycobacterium intracellulare 1956]